MKQFPARSGVARTKGGKKSTEKKEEFIDIVK